MTGKKCNISRQIPVFIYDYKSGDFLQTANSATEAADILGLTKTAVCLRLQRKRYEIPKKERIIFPLLVENIREHIPNTWVCGYCKKEKPISEFKQMMYHGKRRCKKCSVKSLARNKSAGSRCKNWIDWRHKKCITCGEIKHNRHFTTKKNSYKCDPCYKEYFRSRAIDYYHSYKKHKPGWKEKQYERGKRYRETHREKVRAWRREYGKTAKYREYQNRIRASMPSASPEKRHQYYLRYKSRHYDKLIQRGRDYYKIKPEYLKKAAKERAKLRRQLKALNLKMQSASGKKVIPIARKQLQLAKKLVKIS